MRVLMVVQSYFPFQNRGGPVVKVRALAGALSDQGQQVTVLTADLGLANYDQPAVNAKRCNWGWCASEHGVNAIYLPSYAHYRDITFNPHVLGFCRESLRKFDIVHFFGLYDLLGPTVSTFCRKYKIPYVIEPMGMYRPIDRGFMLKRFWHRIIGASYLKHGTLFIATSELEQRELIEDGIVDGKVVVRYNGVSSNRAIEQPIRGRFRRQHGIASRDPLVLFVSRIIPRKGADILIKAFARTCPTIGHLVIAGPEGEPGYVKALSTLAHDLGVSARVLFIGPIYDQAKAELFVDADIFALPSKYENFANVAAEAIAFGVPVILSDGCGISSIVKGRAGLVIPPEIESLVGALDSLLSQPVLHQGLRDGCKSVTAELRWESLAKKMNGYYDQASRMYSEP
jgi:glycosyltransferase involved in cell wall biosynthesis